MEAESGEEPLQRKLSSPTNITVDSDQHDVNAWLSSNFDLTSAMKLAGVNGKMLLSYKRDDFIQVVGLAIGIAIWNELHPVLGMYFMGVLKLTS